jgi:hypothetical protein
LKLEFHGTKVAADAGLPAYRELDEALALTTMIKSEFCDNRKILIFQDRFDILLEMGLSGVAEQI